MEEDYINILSILEELSSDDMSKLGAILQGKKIEKDCKISTRKLENLDAKTATKLFITYFENPLNALKCCLDDIPRKDLTRKIAKIEADKKNQGEAQNNEKFALLKSYPISSDRPPYTGKYTLFDLQDYATKNQDQLIMYLEKILKPDEFNELKKELMCRVLNKCFLFTAQKYYELFRNGDLKFFLKNNGKSKKIPTILLNVLFSKKKNNRKRKAEKQMQRQGNINLQKKQLVSIDDDGADDDNVPDKVTVGIENEKIIPIHPTEHKPSNEDSNVIDNNEIGNEGRNVIDNEIGNEDRNVIDNNEIGNEDRNVIDNNEIGNEDRNMIDNNEIGNEDRNVTEDLCLDEDSKKVFKNWYEEKQKEYTEKISLNYISIHEHQAYHCFIVQDVLQFKLPESPYIHILAIQDPLRDFTSSGNLKKEVEFALQFNMAVLDVQFSEVISNNEFNCKRKVDGTFAESENYLKKMVFEIVLPVLALYKWVNLNAFENAVYPNKESESEVTSVASVFH